MKLQIIQAKDTLPNIIGRQSRLVMTGLSGDEEERLVNT